jgi:hypothetical protein
MKKVEKKYLPCTKALMAGHKYAVMRVSQSGSMMLLSAVHESRERAVCEAERLVKEQYEEQGTGAVFVVLEVVNIRSILNNQKINHDYD